MDELSAYLPNFLFILLRAGIIVMLLPFIGSRNFPAQMKIGLAVAIALILTPVVHFNVAENGIPAVVFHEIVLGIAFGFAARFVFFAMEMAGQIISNTMGLTIANVFNPEMGQSTELSQFFGFIAMLVFLSMDAHHDLIYMFVKSYEWLPAGEVKIAEIFPAVLSLSGVMFVIALKLSAPVVMIMVISHVLLGFIYKAAPQINVFFVAYPIYLFVGFLMMFAGTPVLINALGLHLGTMREEVLKVIAAAGGKGV